MPESDLQVNNALITEDILLKSFFFFLSKQELMHFFFLFTISIFTFKFGVLEYHLNEVTVTFNGQGQMNGETNTTMIIKRK